MKRAIFDAGFLLVMWLVMSPVQAEGHAKEAGENASESGKNEITICKKLTPINFSIGSDFKEEDRVEALNKYEVTLRLEYAIACEIERQGYVAAKPFQIMGTVTNFRLRSGEAAVIAGVMAGVDKLAMKVDVVVSGDKPYQFNVSDSTGKGGFRMPTASQRLNYMVQKVSRDVTNKLLNAGFLAEPFANSPGNPAGSMGDSIMTGNRDILLRITKSLSQQKEPVDISILDKIADRIYLSQMETDGGMADTLAHMCKLLGNSKNGKYKQMLREVSEKAAHKTLRKYAAKSADMLPDTSEQPYSPLKQANL